jgi:phosphoadenosine phosphosulfate reductase
MPLAADPYDDNPATSRIVLEIDGRIAGGGLVLGLSDGAAAPAPLRRHDAGALDELASQLSQVLPSLSPGERLLRLRQSVAGKIVFTTSFGVEDQLITDLIATHDLDVEIATLDTGRLFEETHAVWAATEQRYGRRIRAFYPRQRDLEALIAKQGSNGFYDSKDARLACCHVRKVEPLERALSDTQAWITGLRAEQSAYRKDMALVSADRTRGLVKLNPLFDLTRDQVLELIAKRAIPINGLHAKGYASIGCAPCTRPVAAGENERAGRWWWEDQTQQECGQHLRDDRAGRPRVLVAVLKCDRFKLNHNHALAS